MTNGPIEIIVRSINHDGQSLLTPIDDALGVALDAYGLDSRTRPELEHSEGLTNIRNCQKIVTHIGRQMNDLIEHYRFGVPPEDILSTIDSSLFALANLMVDNAQIVVKDAFGDQVDISSSDHKTLLVCCKDLQAFIAKMQEIGNRLVKSRDESVSLKTEFSRALADVRAKHLKVNCVVDGRFKNTIRKNRGAVYLLFRELLSNSFKYRTSEKEVRIVVQDYSENDTIGLSLTDDGIGIPPEHCVSDIFRMGFRHTEATRLDKVRRGEVAGQGLGLAIVERIVDHLDGTIRAVGEPGNGTKFEIKFEKAA